MAKLVAEHSKPAGVPYDQVEIVLAVRTPVDRTLAYIDAAEYRASMVTQKLIVITGTQTSRFASMLGGTAPG